MSPGQAKRDAQAILDGQRFHPKSGPRPLRGVLKAIGNAVAPIGRAIATAWGNTIGQLAPPLMWLVIIAFFAGGMFLLIHNIQGRAARLLANRVNPDGNGSVADAHLSAVDLETQADTAAAAGNHALAIRLRFQAGFIRLDEAAAITRRPGLTTREVRAILTSNRFDALADNFEAVTYGNAAADVADSTNAREQWPEVVGEAKHG